MGLLFHVISSLKNASNIGLKGSLKSSWRAHRLESGKSMQSWEPSVALLQELKGPAEFCFFLWKTSRKTTGVVYKQSQVSSLKKWDPRKQVLKVSPLPFFWGQVVSRSSTASNSQGSPSCFCTWRQSRQSPSDGTNASLSTSPARCIDLWFTMLSSTPSIAQPQRRLGEDMGGGQKIWGLEMLEQGFGRTQYVNMPSLMYDSECSLNCF